MHMRFRLLFISAIILFCTTLSDNVAAFLFNEDCLSDNASQITAEYIPDYQIDRHEQKLILPRQTNFASQQQVRTISQRHTSQRNSTRNISFISGKHVDYNFLITYQRTYNLLPTGLCETFRHLISLGKLII